MKAKVTITESSANVYEDSCKKKKSMQKEECEEMKPGMANQPQGANILLTSQIRAWGKVDPATSTLPFLVPDKIQMHYFLLVDIHGLAHFALKMHLPPVMVLETELIRLFLSNKNIYIFLILILLDYDIDDSSGIDNQVRGGRERKEEEFKSWESWVYNKYSHIAPKVSSHRPCTLYYKSIKFKA